MNKYTPGPWNVTEDGNVVESEVCDESGLVPAMTATIEGIVPIDDVVVADAHLIATAPELLEALKFAKSAIKSGEPWTPTCEDVIDAAIAKAEGR